jgi:hypothetical protein
MTHTPAIATLEAATDDHISRGELAHTPLAYHWLSHGSEPSTSTPRINGSERWGGGSGRLMRLRGEERRSNR